MTAERFDFDWDLPYRVAGLPFGVTPWTAGVEVSPSELTVRFGPWRLRSALSNIASAEESGDYAFVKTAGPPHLSFSDRGVTFATNARRGLCLRFVERVAGIDPTRRILHPGATLTVAEPERLAEALGHPLS